MSHSDPFDHPPKAAIEYLRLLAAEKPIPADLVLWRGYWENKGAVWVANTGPLATERTHLRDFGRLVLQLQAERDEAGPADLARTEAAGQPTAPQAEQAAERQTDRTPRPRKRRRKPSLVKPTPLTGKQAEAMQIVAEHQGDFTAAAKALGKSRQGVKKLYDKACAKLGKKAVEKAAKTQRLPSDHRGQGTLADANAPDPTDVE
jgi:hypothetical protein